MVFYRKYRPQTIDELDSTAVRDSLTAVLKKDIPHAFLFTGPKGLGKTSTARIIAKVVNCENREEESTLSCGMCDTCVSITNGSSLDVLEIDAASNRGVDEIRELKEKIRLAPVSAKKKIYIIDEVHMLTTEAFNALLKTLEEPPEHAMFMLATTEPHKVPNTILSRCFHILFKPATETELVRSFKRIADGEKVTIDEEALFAVAKLAEGGFRDGAKLLEEVFTIAGSEPVTKELLEKRYQVTSLQSSVTTLLDALIVSDTKKGIEVIESLVSQGTDLTHFLQQVMQQLHALLLAHVTADEKPSISTNDIQGLFMLFSRVSAEMKFAVVPQLPFELAILEWCSTEMGVESGALQHDKEMANKKTTVIAEDDTVTVESMRKHIGNIKKKEALYGVPKPTPIKKVLSEDGEMSASKEAIDLLKTSGDEVSDEWLSHFWETLITEIKNHNHTVAGVLRGCKIKSYADNKLVIISTYKFHKDRLEDTKNFSALTQMAKLLTGKDTEITIELKK